MGIKCNDKYFLSFFVKMRLLVTAAAGPEMKTIKSQIQGLKIPHLDVAFLTTGIGMSETIFSLTKYLERDEKPDFILNIWVCGYFAEKKSCIQIGRIVHAGTGKELLVPLFLQAAPIESILCSETPVIETVPQIETQNFVSLSVNYVDMESWAIAFVADKYKIARMILKVPFDKAGDETKSFDREAALEELKKNIDYKEVLVKVVEHFS
jgi:nucleoside phosphorylase